MEKTVSGRNVEKVFSKSFLYYEQFSWTIKSSYVKYQKSNNTEKGIITTAWPFDLKVWRVIEIPY